VVGTVVWLVMHAGTAGTKRVFTLDNVSGISVQINASFDRETKRIN